MKFVRFRTGGEERYGILEGDQVYGAGGDPFSGLTKEQLVGSLDELDLLTPVQPGKIVCVGLNYEAHVTENDPTRAVPEEPVLFMKPPSALIPHGGTIRIANPDNRTDYEAELVVVIGREARDVSVVSAADHILGYTCGNDVSDRVLQRKDGQWVRAKGFDTYCPLGPCVETDLDISNAKVESRLNGEMRQSQTTAGMIWSAHQLVSYISGVMTLFPGDIVMTGTPEGVGGMKAGDVIEVEVGGIGTLRNRVEIR